jgi:hypothetical protein
MTPLTTPTITIRPAYADDDAALGRLAALDSADVPDRPLLLAEVDGQLRVALSLADGSTIADPFARTSDLVELLRKHAPADRTDVPSLWRHARRRNHQGRGRRRPVLVG